MFSRLVYLLMCLTVLACPAANGACCEVADSEIERCESHCGCGSEHDDAPVVPGRPEPCHDCFCAGALPPGFGVSVELGEAADVWAVAPTNYLAATIGSQRLIDFSAVESPPHGRMLLTSYCRYLL